MSNLKKTMAAFVAVFVQSSGVAQTWIMLVATIGYFAVQCVAKPFNEDDKTGGSKGTNNLELKMLFLEGVGLAVALLFQTGLIPEVVGDFLSLGVVVVSLGITYWEFLHCHMFGSKARSFGASGYLRICTACDRNSRASSVKDFLGIGERKDASTWKSYATEICDFFFFEDYMNHLESRQKYD